MTMTNERLYTTKEVAKILSVSDYRPKDGIKRGVLVPTDIQETKGRYGYKYMFNADSIRKYAKVLNIKPDFSIVGGEEDEINEDGSITLTPENFERVVHGGDISEAKANPTRKNAKILNHFKDAYGMSHKDLAYILNISEKRVDNLMQDHATLTFDNIAALLTAAKVDSITIDTKEWFASDPERYSKLTSWVPYKRAKLMQEYADLQARMKQIEKELKVK